jgi:hypothetical protein
MKNKQRIERALIAKGYTPNEIEFETISYYSSGREGGWLISVECDDLDYNFPDWSEVKLPDGLIVDLIENEIRCYNITDALTAIDLLPKYSMLTTYDD